MEKKMKIIIRLDDISYLFLEHFFWMFVISVFSLEWLA